MALKFIRCENVLVVIETGHGEKNYFHGSDWNATTLSRETRKTTNHKRQSTILLLIQSVCFFMDFQQVQLVLSKPLRHSIGSHPLILQSLSGVSQCFCKLFFKINLGLHNLHLFRKASLENSKWQRDPVSLSIDRLTDTRTTPWLSFTFCWVVGWRLIRRDKRGTVSSRSSSETKRVMVHTAHAFYSRNFLRCSDLVDDDDERVGRWLLPSLFR